MDQLPRIHKEEQLPITYTTNSPSLKATATWTAIVVCLLLLGLGGAGLLVWWALAFHPSNEQLWMVPVSLVLFGTPVIAWLSIFTSSACRRFEMLRNMRTESTQVPAVVGAVTVENLVVQSQR